MSKLAHSCDKTMETLEMSRVVRELGWKEAGVLWWETVREKAGLPPNKPSPDPLFWRELLRLALRD